MSNDYPCLENEIEKIIALTGPRIIDEFQAFTDERASRGAAALELSTIAKGWG
jgi:hypothetical protein